MVLALLSLVFSTAFGAVDLKEDEFILPPLLRSFDGGSILNVQSSESKKRSAKPGEWLEYGDSFDLPARLAMQVIPCENMQWVGGGVFNGRIGTRTWKQERSPYEIHLERGWMKVWVKPDRAHHTIQINTQSVQIGAEKAVFWLTARKGVTEVYLISGEITDNTGRVLRGKEFYTWQGEGEIGFTSKDWDEKPLEVRVAGLYPEFVRVADKAEDEWDRGKTESVYSDLRREGWRKAARLNAPIGPAKRPSK